MEQQLSQNGFDPQWIIAICTFLTLILLGFYTYYTRKIAQATEETMRESLRPIVSCELKSGKNYFEKQLLRRQPGLKNDTRCIVVNHSKYNLEVFVNLNLRLNGMAKEISDGYAGKQAWPLTSFQNINGHFNLASKFDLTNIDNITIDLEVSYKSEIGKLYKNPIQHWNFDRRNGVWVNKIGVAV